MHSVNGNFFPQFFDSDGDGMVSEADLIEHHPFKSLSVSGSHDKEQDSSDNVGDVPNQMNMGELLHEI